MGSALADARERLDLPLSEGEFRRLAVHAAGRRADKRRNVSISTFKSCDRVITRPGRPAAPRSG